MLVVGTTLAATAVLMIGVWLISLLKKDASIVDIFWGLGFVLIATVSSAMGDGYGPRKILIALPTAVWGFRLAIHIFWRNKGKGEDFRYRAMRSRFRTRFAIMSLITVFGLQGLLMWIISLPIQMALISPLPAKLGVPDWGGASVWLIGFVFESVGDFQLALFKSDAGNRGKVMNRGLWRYTRHPNYFGDSLVWWGFFLIALSVPRGIWTVISPLIMTGLLMKVSGVALLEKALIKTKPDYRDYVRKTSPFVPWFHRD